ncbi:ImmA/IrrE family metallo-endopeptidase [Streptomyces tremellae]|uniref:IrrE N-terminal-like domain-containing protein n=1 Tax=Streptomyces tremellae TaxID=1124239 RepID=A0ABP7F449_9ACTN
MLNARADDPIYRLSDRVADVGLLAFSRDIGKDTAGAGTVLLRRGGVGLVNSHMKVGRRRLALAHELCHFLIADDCAVDWRVATHSDRDVPMESRLGRFARALLLPAAAVGGKWQEEIALRDERGAAIVLAGQF